MRGEEATTNEKVLRVIETLAGLIFVTFLAVFVFQGLVDSNTWSLRDLQDYRLTYELSRIVLETHAYPADYTYPPPSMALKLIFGAPGVVPSAFAWMGVLVGSIILSFVALFRLRPTQDARPTYTLCLIALLPVVYYVQWDLRSINSNSLLLALALGSLVTARRGQTVLAGALLAASISWKLYSAIMLPWLLWRRQFHLVIATTAWLIVFFIALPAIVFGPLGALEITSSWLAAISKIGSGSFALNFVAYSMSLVRVALAYTTTEGSISGNPWIALPINQVLIAVRVIHGLWVIGVTVLILVPRDRLKKDSRTLFDLSLLWLMVLALSPQLQPHHAVLLLVPSFVFADRLFDRQENRSVRFVAILLMVAAPIAMKMTPSGIGRGLTLQLILVSYAIGIAWIRFKTTSLTSTKTTRALPT